MKLFASILIAATLAVPAIASAQSILILDGLTDTTNRYISGELEPRLVELGQNLQTKENFPTWRNTQEHGVQRHCFFTQLARAKNASLCGFAKTR